MDDAHPVAVLAAALTDLRSGAQAATAAATDRSRPADARWAAEGSVAVIQVQTAITSLAHAVERFLESAAARQDIDPPALAAGSTLLRRHLARATASIAAARAGLADQQSEDGALAEALSAVRQALATVETSLARTEEDLLRSLSDTWGQDQAHLVRFSALRTRERWRALST